MNFGANKTPVEVIKKDAFGGTYFRHIYSGVNGKWYRKSWKEFDELRDIDQKYYCSNYYDVNVNKYGVKCGTSLRFCKNNRWINGLILQILLDVFSGILDNSWVEDLQMMKDKLIEGKEL